MVKVKSKAPWIIAGCVVGAAVGGYLDLTNPNVEWKKYPIGATVGSLIVGVFAWFLMD